MIGLKRGCVALDAYRAEWKREAVEIAGKLRTIFGEQAVAIEHIGSTAIEGIGAKPIIDIAVGVRGMDGLEETFAAMLCAGYRESVNQFSQTNRLFVFEYNEDGGAVRTQQVHVLPYDSQQWHNYVDFRDYMNAHPERARAYEELKQRLVRECGGVQRVYTDGKREFMEKELAAALQWAKNR